MARSVTVIPARSQKVRTGHKAVQEKKIRGIRKTSSIVLRHRSSIIQNISTSMRIMKWPASMQMKAFQVQTQRKGNSSKR